VWRRLQPLAIKKIPLDVPPPRTSRFGSSLLLSRVHLVRPDFVEQGLKVLVHQRQCVFALDGSGALAEPELRYRCVGRIEQRRRNRAFCCPRIGPRIVILRLFSMTGIIRHWPVNAAPSTQKGLLRWNECVIPLDTEAQVPEEFRRSIRIGKREARRTRLFWSHSIDRRVYAPASRFRRRRYQGEPRRVGLRLPAL